MKPPIEFRRSRPTVADAYKEIAPAKPAEVAVAPKPARAKKAKAKKPEPKKRGPKPKPKPEVYNAKTLVQEVRRASYSTVDPLAMLAAMSRPELEALAAQFIIEKARRQKRHAEAMKKWRHKVREVLAG